MKIAVLVPDNEAWMNAGRSGLMSLLLEQDGHQPEVIPVKEECPANLRRFSIVFNHAVQVHPDKIRKAATQFPRTLFVNAFHSALSHAEMSSHRMNRLFPAIHSARQVKNIWLAFTGSHDIGAASNLKRFIQLALPCPEIKAARKRKKPDPFLVVVGGRVDPVKSQLAQIAAFAIASKRIQAELCFCLDPAPWMSNALKAFGVRAVSRGLLPHSYWLEFLRSEAGVLLNCSHAESLGQAAVEAASSGVPVIGSQALDFGEFALKCNPDNSSEISDSIIAAYEQWGEFSRLATRAGTVRAKMSRREYSSSVRFLVNISEKINGIPQSND